MFGPAGTPRNIVTGLHREIARAFSQPETKERIVGMGLDIAVEAPDLFSAFVKKDIEKMRTMVTQSGAIPD